MKCLPRAALPLLAVAWAAGAGPAHAADKFKVTNVECELFWLWKHTPVLHYDIVDERKADYDANPADEYFRQAAARTAEYCDRTSARPQTPLNPPRKIRGIWFQSNDGAFKILYDLDHDAVDASAGVVNTIGDRYAAGKRAEAQHQAELEAIRTRETRAEEVRLAELEATARREAQAREIKAAEAKAARDKVVAEVARESVFFGSRDLQLARLGAAATAANFATIDNVRTNPFHYKKLGVAVVRTQFNRMVTDKLALFGNELAPILVHIEDVDRFTRSGETVMLALKIIERGEVERSYGSLPEIIVSALKAEPIFGDYVGAYTCPGDDCQHIFDAPPPT